MSLFVERQKPIYIDWDGKKIERKAFRADLIIEN